MNVDYLSIIDEACVFYLQHNPAGEWAGEAAELRSKIANKAITVDWVVTNDDYDELVKGIVRWVTSELWQTALSDRDRDYQASLQVLLEGGLLGIRDKEIGEDDTDYTSWAANMLNWYTQRGDDPELKAFAKALQKDLLNRSVIISWGDPTGDKRADSLLAICRWCTGHTWFTEVDRFIYARLQVCFEDKKLCFYE